jgi:hypothetical protein
LLLNNYNTTRCNRAGAGELIRVLEGCHTQQPENLDVFVEKKEAFKVFFPLSYAVKRGIVEYVASYSDIKHSKPQFMRTEHAIRGEFLGWHIVNTDTLERRLVTVLSDGEKQLSPWGIWNDTLLKEMMEIEWSLEKWL